MKPVEASLTLPNDIETIPQLSEFVETFCEEQMVDMSITLSLNLAIEEAVVNVMSYAYPAGTYGEVLVKAIADDKVLTFIISDNGIPFDPTAKADVDTSLSAEERPIGGLGIHLVKQIMDSVDYQYTDGQNVLTLKKNIHP